MEKSKQGTGSTVNVSAEAVATMAAPSQPSPPSASKRTSAELGLSNADLMNILMVDLNRFQERFGKVHFLRMAGDEPAMLVLPKPVDVCYNCGRIIKRTGDKSFCEVHAPKAEPVPQVP